MLCSALIEIIESLYATHFSLALLTGIQAVEDFADGVDHQKVLSRDRSQDCPLRTNNKPDYKVSKFENLVLAIDCV